MKVTKAAKKVMFTYRLSAPSTTLSPLEIFEKMPCFLLVSFQFVEFSEVGKRKKKGSWSHLRKCHFSLRKIDFFRPSNTHSDATETSKTIKHVL